MRTHILGVVAALLLPITLVLLPKDADALLCGPGAHWVDGCAGGLDIFPSTAVVGIDFDFDNIADVTVILNGPSMVKRFEPSNDSSNFPGL
ncbi:MAG: hypothetical protein JRH10_22300, partial [Deltaproteobacteria bacterium]|nr:hypothetical protein [Deltaproteobacteria bacterium]